MWAALIMLRIKSSMRILEHGNAPWCIQRPLVYSWTGSATAEERLHDMYLVGLSVGQPPLLLYALSDSRCVCVTHILGINTQARLLAEKHFSCRLILTKVYINKLETFPLSTISIYIRFFNIPRRFLNPCRKNMSCPTNRFAPYDK